MPKLTAAAITKHFTDCWDRYYEIHSAGGVDRMWASRTRKAEASGNGAEGQHAVGGACLTDA